MNLEEITLENLVEGEGYLVYVHAPDYPKGGQWWTLAECKGGSLQYDEHRIVIEALKIYELPDEPSEQ